MSGTDHEAREKALAEIIEADLSQDGMDAPYSVIAERIAAAIEDSPYAAALQQPPAPSAIAWGIFNGDHLIGSPFSDKKDAQQELEGWKINGQAYEIRPLYDHPAPSAGHAPIDWEEIDHRLLIGSTLLDDQIKAAIKIFKDYLRERMEGKA